MDVQKAKEKTRENHAKIFAGLSQLSILKFYLNITGYPAAADKSPHHS